METNYLRLVELRALVKECGLQGYHRLKKAELIALLRDTSVVAIVAMGTDSTFA